MSSSFIWLAVILTLVSAFVAYLGDLLGRHVGKRKIKLFGLRPRDSAIVVTSVTGGLITLITILVLLLGNASLNRMAKSADEVIRLQKEATAKISEAKQVVDAANKTIADSNAKLIVIRDQQKTLETQIKKLNDQMAETTAEMTSLQNENTRLDLDLAKKTAQEKVLAGKLKDLSARRDRLTKVIDANSSYILEQETALAHLRTEATTLASTVKQYRAGEVVIPEGTCVAQVTIDLPEDRNKIRTLLRNTQDAVRLPAEIVPVWPSAAELEAAIVLIEGKATEKQAAVVFESQENALVGSAMQVAIRVLPSAVIYRPGPESVIKLWLLENTLNESQAYTAITEISPQISERAISREGGGLVPLMGDRRLVEFDALSLARLATDLATAAVPAYIAFQATTEIGPFDLLRADKNFTWRILPTGEPVPE